MIGDAIGKAFLAVIIAGILCLGYTMYLIVRFTERSEACEARGGEFVRIQQGWTCLRIKELKV